jgi:hypothetical protein
VELLFPRGAKRTCSFAELIDIVGLNPEVARPLLRVRPIAVQRALQEGEHHETMQDIPWRPPFAGAALRQPGDQATAERAEDSDDLGTVQRFSPTGCQHYHDLRTDPRTGSIAK